MLLSKTSISAPKRGSDTHFDTKWPFHLLCKLCACSWYQILIKRVKKRWLRPRLSGMNSPLSCRGTWASLLPRRWVGASSAASRAHSTLRHTREASRPGPSKGWAPRPIVASQSGGLVSLNLFSLDWSQAVVLFGRDTEWILSVPLK